MNFFRSLVSKNKQDADISVLLRGVSARYTQNVIVNAQLSNNDYTKIASHENMIIAVVADGMGQSANAFRHAKLATDLVCEKIFNGALKQGTTGLSTQDVTQAIRTMLQEVAADFETQNTTLGSESTLVLALVCWGLNQASQSSCKVFATGIGDSSAMIFSSSESPHWRFLYAPNTFDIITTMDFYNTIPIATEDLRLGEVVVVSSDGFTDQMLPDYKARKANETILEIMESIVPDLTMGSGSFLSSLLRVSMTQAVHPSKQNEEGQPMILDDVAISIIYASLEEDGKAEKGCRIDVKADIFDEEKLETEFRAIAKGATRQASLMK